MGIIAVPSTGPADWQRALADPELHWKPGASAMTLAASWEAAGGEFPPEVVSVLNASGVADLMGLQPRIIIPEFRVPLPGGDRASQTDVFALARGPTGLVPIAVEGKVEEPFGPELGAKRRDASPGLTLRLDFLHRKLNATTMPGDIRYQLLHRTVSALLLAEQFRAACALMLVHSFSAEGRGFREFSRFAEVLGATVKRDHIVLLPGVVGCRLYIGWCSGDRRFTSADLRAAPCGGRDQTHT